MMALWKSGETLAECSEFEFECGRVCVCVCVQALGMPVERNTVRMLDYIEVVVAMPMTRVLQRWSAASAAAVPPALQITNVCFG